MAISERYVLDATQEREQRFPVSRSEGAESVSGTRGLTPMCVNRLADRVGSAVVEEMLSV